MRKFYASLVTLIFVCLAAMASLTASAQGTVPPGIVWAEQFNNWSIQSQGANQFTFAQTNNCQSFPLANAVPPYFVFGTDAYYLNQTACTPATSTDSGCAATQTISQADTNYEAFIQMTSSGGAWLLATVTTKSTTSIAYQVTCTYNCTTMGTVSADIHVHHP